MRYWNHFAECPYEKIKFTTLSIGDIFRSHLWKGKRSRGYIICIKTGDIDYTEQKSKKVQEKLPLIQRHLLNGELKIWYVFIGEMKYIRF